MTSINPSHNPFRQPEGRHAQATYRPSAEDDEKAGESPSRREGRRRVRAAVPPLPDLRFEQSFLLSIRPYLHPRPTASDKESRGPVTGQPAGQQALSVEPADSDSVFHWGREVNVDWSPIAWVTVRDQGVFWGVLGIALSTSSALLRGSLFPRPSHGRVSGGPGGSIREAGGGEAIGGSWWQRFIKSWAGAAETVAA